MLIVQGMAPAAALALVLLATGGTLARAEEGPVSEAVDHATAFTALLRISGEPVALGQGAFGGGERFVVDAVVTGGVLGGTVFAAATPVVVMGSEQWGGLGTGDTVRVPGTAKASDRIGRATAVFVPASKPTIEKADGLLGYTAELRGEFRDLSLGEDRDGGLLPGMALGDRTGLDPALAEAMKTTGLTHLTAVSGANCSYVIGFAYLGLRAVRLPRLPAGLGAVVALLGFVLLVRPEPSVLRAALMGTIGVAAVLSGRGKVSLSLLLVSIMVLLAADPWLCLSFAFILSVLANLGLITAGPMVVHVLERTMPRFMAQLLAIPLTAQLFCTPVIVLIQPSLPLYSLPANVLTAPVVPGITLLGMLAVLALVAVPFLAHPLIVAAQWGTRWVACVSEVFAAAPAASLPWLSGPAGTAAAVLGSVLFLLLLLLLSRYETLALRRSAPGERCHAKEQGSARTPRQGRLRRSMQPEPEPQQFVVGQSGGGRPRRPALLIALCVAVCLVAGFVLFGRHAPPPRAWIMTMCDVGQGDGIVIRTTDRHALVVDVGPDPEAMDHCLDLLGIEAIDALVISHLHEDHYGGIEGAIRGRTVAALYYSTGEDELPGIMTQAAATADVDATRLTGTTSLDLPPLSVDVLWAGGRAAGAEENDASAVLEIIVPTAERPVSVLLMGDLEEQAARVLLTEQPGLAAGTVDVLKIAHHGARNSGTALIESLRPGLALISVGSDNDYGHPHPITLAALDASGIPVARTDELGSFTLDVVDTALEVQRIG